MRPRHFDDAEELKYFFDEYVEKCRKEKKTPNLAGFASSVYTTTVTLYSYRKPGHPFLNTMDYIFDTLHENWLQNGKLSDRMKEFLLKSHIRDIYSESKLTINNNINNNVDLNDEKLTDEDLITRIQQAKEKVENLPSLTTPTT